MAQTPLWALASLTRTPLQASFLHSQRPWCAEPCDPAAWLLVQPALVGWGCLERPALLSGITRHTEDRKRSLGGTFSPQTHRYDDKPPAPGSIVARFGGKWGRRDLLLPRDLMTKQPLVVHSSLEKVRLLWWIKHEKRRKLALHGPLSSRKGNN